LVYPSDSAQTFCLPEPYDFLRKKEKMTQTVFILIGPKGSGKSYIGELMASHLGIPFLSVEPIFLAIKNDPKGMTGDFIAEGFKRVETTIHQRLKTNDSLVFEATGLTPYFDKMLKNLEQQYRVIKIKVFAPPETCLTRIRQRDASVHIPVSEEMITHINSACADVKLNFNLTIDNSASTKESILAQLKTLPGYVLPGKSLA
jgi:predicted kinase